MSGSLGNTQSASMMSKAGFYDQTIYLGHMPSDRSLATQIGTGDGHEMPEQSKPIFYDYKRNRQSNNTAYLRWWIPLYWMIALLVLAIVFAGIHHGLNTYLHNMPTSTLSQSWSHNIGTAAAFGVKTCCHLAIALCCQEVLWFTVRKRNIRISTLDNMFTLLNNPLSFTPSTWRSAWLLSLLALFAWVIPLAAIASIGTLTVGTHTLESVKQCVVPTYAGASSQMYSVPPHGGTLPGPDLQIDRMAAHIFPFGSIANFPSPCGDDCTYRQTFYAPTLDCRQIGDYLNTTIDQQMRNVYFYEAITYSSPIKNTSSSSSSLALTYKNSNIPVTLNSSPGYSFSFLNCSAANASYSVDVTFKAGLPSLETELQILEHIPSVQSDGLGHQLANAQALVQEVFSWLTGDITGSPTAGSISSGSKIGQTSLVDLTSDHWTVSTNFSSAIPQMLTNLTLSTLSFTASNETTTCTITEGYQAYQYAPFWLVFPYSLSILATAAATLVALSVLRMSGFRTGNVFSQILITTRNSELDSLAVGNSVSSVGLGDELANRRLRFGQVSSNDQAYELVDGSTALHAAFGTSQAVTNLRRNQRYI